MINLREYQSKSVEEVKLALSKYRRVLFQLPTGGGKCLSANTPILMFDGSVKMVQDVSVGDLLMGPDSEYRRVESTCRGREMMYRITPNKGDAFECNESHILALQYSDAEHGNAFRNVSVRDYLSLSKNEKHLLKLYRRGVEFPDRNVAIDPYILGQWLADGTKACGTPEISVCDDDVDVLNYLISRGGHLLAKDKRGLRYSRVSFAGIGYENSLRANSCLYRDEFKKCVLPCGQIGIPDEYKINSREKRLQLLAGLLDGDGFTNRDKGGYEIITKYTEMRDDILYLARSLGFAAYWSEKRVDISRLKDSTSNEIRTYYRITISGFCEDIPVKSFRKKSLLRKMNKDVLRTGFSVEKIGVGDYYGFEISGNDRLFLLGDFTVTHNTVCFSYITLASQRFNRKVLILSSRTEILLQNGGALEQAGLTVQYISPRMRSIPTANVCVGMAQTLRRRVEKEEWCEWLKTVEMLIIDEAHECVSDFIHEYMSDKCFVLGVTATPRRYGHQKQLGTMYRAMVTGITVKELIELKYLSKAHHYSVVAPKLDDVEIDYGTGDYNQRSLAAKFEDKRLYTGLVQEFLRLVPDKKAIFFCCSSQQTIDLTKELNAFGISARYLLSGTFDTDEQYSGERSDVIDDFKANKFQVLVNLGIAIAGFDVPDVEVVALCFSTISLTKYLQAIGRGSRVTGSKHEFTILDAGENYRKHGAYDSERIWSLWHDEKLGVGEVPMKLCDPKKKDINGKYGCDMWVPMTCSYCPHGGFKFPTEKDEFQLHLEEIVETAEPQSLVSWAAQKKREGWKLSRIMIQACLSNSDNPKEAFIKVYTTLYKGKTREDAAKYWFVWNKNVWQKVKRKQQQQNETKLF